MQSGSRRAQGGGAVRGSRRGGTRPHRPPGAADAAQLRRQRRTGMSASFWPAIDQPVALLPSPQTVDTIFKVVRCWRPGKGE